MLLQQEPRLHAIEAVHDLHLQAHGLSTSYWATAYPSPTPPAARGSRACVLLMPCTTSTSRPRPRSWASEKSALASSPGSVMR